MIKLKGPSARTSKDIFIAYGANLPDGALNALQAFSKVVKRLRGLGIAVQAVSSLWKSQAWPNPDDPPYHNAVLSIDTILSPEALLGLLHEMEAQSGRTRATHAGDAVNAPRILDLDLIAYGDQILQGEVVLPHPRAHERGFVMGPLCEIAPDWRHPVNGLTARALFAGASVGRDAYPAVDTSDLPEVSDF